MNDKALQMQLGVGALVAAAFLLLVAIPYWVSSPSNVPNIFLSPVFWPNTLAVLTGLTGISLILTSRSAPEREDSTHSDEGVDRRAAYSRLAVLVVIMAGTLYAMPRLGLVWTSMLVFASLAFLVRTSHPKAALICSVVVPLVLYLFFAHVAGVAIPQGNFVRLP